MSVDGIRLAIQDLEPLVRAYAYRDLAEIAAPEVSDLLDAASKSRMIADFEGDDHPLEVVEAALKAYARFGFSDRRLHPRLHELSRNETTQIRIAALEAIGSACDASGVVVIRERLEQDDSSTVRVAALRVARNLARKCRKPVIDIDSLLDLIVDRDPLVREEALGSLQSLKSELGGRRLTHELLELLRQQQDTQLCVSLLQALKETGVPGAMSLPELARLCPGGVNSPPAVRREIRTHALLAIADHIPLADLFAYLEQPDAIDTSAVFEIMSQQFRPEQPELAPFLDRPPDRTDIGNTRVKRLADFLDVTALTEVDEADELDRLIETHEAALAMVKWSGRASDYTEDILRIIETTPPDKDYLGRLRNAALGALRLAGGQGNVDPSMRRLIAFMAGDSPVDYLSEKIVEAYWRNRPLALMHLNFVAEHLHGTGPVVQARAASVLGHDKESARIYVPILWHKFFEGESEGDDGSDLVRSAVLRVIGKSDYPEPYLNEIASLLRSEQNDPLGELRIAAIDVLSSREAYLHLYVGDLIHMLENLSSEVERKTLELLKRRRLEPRHFLLLLNSTYTPGRSASTEHRYLTLYFGASPPENKLLLDLFGLSNDELDRTDPDRTKSLFRMLADLVRVEGLHPLLRNRIALELGHLGFTTEWTCPDQELLSSTAETLLDEKLLGLEYSREAAFLASKAASFDAAYCADQEKRKNMTFLAIGVIVVLFVTVVLRGFRV